MTEEHTRVVTGAICSVLEKLAFVFAEPLDNHRDLAWPDTTARSVSMSFTGVLRGEFELYLPPSLCVAIAANMLGEDGDTPQAKTRAEDAIAEVLNVICGQILTDLAGERPMFTFTIPTVAHTDTAQLRARTATDPACIGFTVDGAPLLARFCLEDTP